MNEWFRKAFSSQYLWLYAHRDEEEAEQTVELILSAVHLTPGSTILDIPCGGGRHARRFASRGMRVLGCDLSEDLLNAAQGEQTSLVQFARCDMRVLPVRDEAADLVTNLFSSFGYFREDAENARAMNEFSRVCKRSGHLVMDFMNEPRLRESLLPYSERTSEEGSAVKEYRQITGTPPRVEKRIVVTNTQNQTLEVTESVRLYSPMELREMMQVVGFDVRHMFGDYEGRELSQSSPRAILIGEKR